MKLKVAVIAANLLIITNIYGMDQSQDVRQKSLRRQMSLNSISSYGQNYNNLPTGSGQTNRNDNNGYHRKTKSGPSIPNNRTVQKGYPNDNFCYLSEIVSDLNNTIQQQAGKITALQKKVGQSESRLVALENTALWQNKQIEILLMALYKNLSETRGANNSNPPIVDPATTDLFLALSSQKMKMWKSQE